MATTKYSGDAGAAQALNYTRTVALSGGSSISGARIDSVVAASLMSTNAYSNTYQVRVRLLDSGGATLAEVTRTDIKFTSSNYGGAIWEFNFGTSVDVNSIASISFFGLNEASKIFVKNTPQTVTVDYTVRTACTAPTSVSLSASLADPGANVTLSWSGAVGGAANAITGYKIQRSTDGGSWADWQTDNASPYTVKAHSDWGHYYDYRVITVGEYIDSGASSSVRLTTRTPTKATAPTSASVSPTLAETNPTLSWSGAAGGTLNAISSYEIQYAESADNSIWGAWTALKTVTSTATSGSTEVALPATRGYYRKYQIRARGAAGATYYSNWKITNAVRYNRVPSAPTSFIASPDVYVSGYISLVYSGATDPDGKPLSHNVQYAMSADGVTWGAWTSLANNATTHTPTLGANAYIKYRVRAVDSAGGVSGYLGSNVCAKNTAPGNLTINYPQAGKTTHNSRPRFLVTLGTDPESHMQVITAAGYTASRASNLAAGAKVILRRTNDATAGTVSVSAKAADVHGLETSAVTRDTTYTAPDYTDTIEPGGLAKVKAAHMTELRTMVNTIREYYGLSTVVWNEAIVAGVTKSRNWKAHITELRSAINDVVTLINTWDELSTTNRVPPFAWTTITEKPNAAAMNQLREVITWL